MIFSTKSGPFYGLLEMTVVCSLLESQYNEKKKRILDIKIKNIVMGIIEK